MMTLKPDTVRLLKQRWSFSGSIEEKVKRSMRCSELLGKVLEEWENIVYRVAKAEVGEKVIVCGRSVRWWADYIKEKIQERREVYKRIGSGEKDLWEQYVTQRG